MNYIRHYCYKITFDDGYVYFGSRSCRCPVADDSYMGSPFTHAAKWLTGIPRVKQIVSIHATRQLANKAEAELIIDFWAVDKALSLNACVHAARFNTLGRTCTDETRAKKSVAQLGRTRTDETRAKMSAAKFGKMHTDEARAKISAAKKGKTLTDETRAKLSAANIGKTLTDETRAKLSAAKRGRKCYTNGETNVFLAPGADVPTGFSLGKAKFAKVAV